MWDEIDVSICVLCKLLCCKQHLLCIDLLFFCNILQWVQLERLKKALKCNDTCIFISSCVTDKQPDAHLMWIFILNSTNIQNSIFFQVRATHFFITQLQVLHHGERVYSALQHAPLLLTQKEQITCIKPLV